MTQISDVLTPRGMIIGRFGDLQRAVLDHAGFLQTLLTTPSPFALILARRGSTDMLNLKASLQKLRCKAPDSDMVLVSSSGIDDISYR